ncbi:DHC10 [Symbiodinium sp. CCMP2592]|nr:DHC10 [Symbiodinium sp. CCMP2592]
MPSPKVPLPTWQSGIKITNEPPKGLRANLGRTCQAIGEDVFESCPSKPAEHGPQHCEKTWKLERSWDVPYEWLDSDFQVSREQVRMCLVSQPDVPWITLRYIIARANYGGRGTDDDKDVRLISAVLKGGYFSGHPQACNGHVRQITIFS